MFKKIIYLFIFFTSFFLILTSNVQAQDFRNDYQVEYFLNQNQNKLETKVKFNVKITNFRSDLYVKEFSIGFPKSFQIHDIKASDDHTTITPKITLDQKNTKINLEFSDAAVGRGSVNNLYLEFNQDNLFLINGNVWEVIIPTIEDKTDSSYKVTVNLPPNSRKPLSISKPKPTSISGTQFTWDNPSQKTIYVIFGDVQYYNLDLRYRFKNSQIVPVYTDIAFPPDTLYQKIYIEDINPAPAKIIRDEDGNYLGRYYLSPKATEEVSFKGKVSVFAKPREEVISSIRADLSNQKNYLLSDEKNWSISSKFNLSGSKNIYNFVTTKLSYNYKKVNESNIRLGAELALARPNQAICMEFTDLFIALARKNGIYAREIEGFGFSNDPNLRPLSLSSDVLHSWPEYYDINSNLWIPVDPTWENTSGIDYFSSLDLNHIAFVIHGKSSVYPPPAGTYKIEDSKDVSVKAAVEKPQEIKKISSSNLSIPPRVVSGKFYQVKFNLLNNGNTFRYGDNILVGSENLEFNRKNVELDSLAPLESVPVSLNFKVPKKNTLSTADVKITLPDGKIINQQIQILPFYFDYLIKGLSVLFIFIILFIIFMLFKNKHHLSFPQRRESK